MNLDALYDKALKTYGPDLQMWVTVEEAGELIQALSKHKRHPGKNEKEKVAEEIADLQIMLEQMAAYFGRQRVECYRVQKIGRLATNLANR